jgi:hypothetical protein
MPPKGRMGPVNQAKLLTRFAPAARRSPEEVRRLRMQVVQAPHVYALLECFPVPAMLLNQERQLLAANQKLASLVGRPVEDLLGLRPGEIFKCIHSTDEQGGCGTSVFCSMCGATRAILEHRTEECRMTCHTPHGWQALDLRVQAAPLHLGRDRFTVVSLLDITSEKRRMVLEQMFFHDVLDTATGIHGVLDLLPGLSDPEAAKLLKLARRLSGDLLEQIRAGRDLSAAERGELKTDMRPLQVSPFLARLCALYCHLPIYDGKSIVHRCHPASATILTDERLLSRVLGNLIKNALEASSSGQTVTVEFDHENGAATFSVHNQSVMPEPVKLQIFQRSFSTKAAHGRGIGTYSVKMIAERYLKCRVTFSSDPVHGTIFTVTLPPG